MPDPVACAQARPLFAALVIIALLVYIIARDAFRHRRLRHQVVRLHVATQFCRFPARAVPEDGAWCGDDVSTKLVELPKDPAIVRVNWDGTMGYGSSFLKAAFGGLDRDLPELRLRMTFE